MVLIPSKKRSKKRCRFVADLSRPTNPPPRPFYRCLCQYCPEFEIETLKWLMDVVQDATDTPLCIDSPNPVGDCRL